MATWRTEVVDATQQVVLEVHAVKARLRLHGCARLKVRLIRVDDYGRVSTS